MLEIIVEAIFIGGQNGCGKSTFTSGMSKTMPVLDPDAFGPQGASQRTRARALLTQVDKNIIERQSFIIESTFSGNSILRQMQQAKDCGFYVSFHFISIQGLEMMKTRVQTRHNLGGHDVPVIDQDRRFRRSANNAVKAARIAHQTSIYDNSTSQPNLYLTYKLNEEIKIIDGAPRWVEKFNDKLHHAVAQEKNPS